MNMTLEEKEPGTTQLCPWDAHLVTIMFDEVKYEATIHEWEKVIQEESQADVHLFCLFIFLKNKPTPKSFCGKPWSGTTRSLVGKPRQTDPYYFSQCPWGRNGPKLVTLQTAANTSEPLAGVMSVGLNQAILHLWLLFRYISFSLSFPICICVCT